MSVSKQIALNRWEQGVIDGVAPTTKSGRTLSMDGGKIFGEMGSPGDTPDVLYSYGHHFRLIEVHRNKRGKVTVILLNSDRYSSSTSQHQSEARGIATRFKHTLGIEPILLPFSALESAGIDHSSIQPRQIRPDRNEVIPRSSNERPGELCMMDDPNGSTVTEKRWNYSRHPITEIDVEVPAQVPNLDRCYVGKSHWQTADRGADGIWRWEDHRHWMGDSLFSAITTETREVKMTPAQRELTDKYMALIWEYEEARQFEREEWRKSSGYRLGVPFGPVRSDVMLNALYDEVERLQDARGKVWHDLQGTLRDNEWLSSGSNIRISKQVKRRSLYLSSFDYQEARALYFLCELPRSSKAETVEQALEDLKPPEVMAAEEQGLTVTRQGDVFAIPVALDTRTVKKLATNVSKRGKVLGTDHSCTEVATLPGGITVGRGTMYHDVASFRQRDHARRRMVDGKCWNLLVRNTVPRQR